MFTFTIKLLKNEINFNIFSFLTIKNLNSSRRSIFSECALGDFRKNSRHGIDSILRIGIYERQHFIAICRKFVAQKCVDEINLQNCIGKVETLTDEESKRVELMAIEIFTQINNQNVLLSQPFVRIEQRVVEIEDEMFHSVALPQFPQISRCVEKNCCRKKNYELHKIAKFPSVQH